MLRAVSNLCIENRILELVAVTRRANGFTALRRSAVGCGRGLHVTTAASAAAAAPPAAAPPAAAPPAAQTVLTAESGPPPAKGGAAPPPHALPPPHPPPPPPPPRRWPAAALAAALTASLGGVYFYRKMSDESGPTPGGPAAPPAAPPAPPVAEGKMEPLAASSFPEHVQYLVVGAGTAAFAAMRAIRAARPDARVLLVGDERALPYMRPPLSKELWREPELAARAAADPDALTFRQWNGKRRPVVYEPAAFYAPVGELHTRPHGGAAVARGWRVVALDVVAHTARLEPAGGAAGGAALLRYDKVLVATGSRARRAPALREAAAAGRSLTLRGLRDAARLARELERQDVRTVAVLGGGFLASELSAALAERLQGSGRRVLQLVAEDAPMANVLPDYLAQDAARRLRDAGVELLTGAELAEAAPGAQRGGALRLRLVGRAEPVEADLVVECVGAEPDTALAEASGLETHPTLGGLLVNAEMMARADVYVAGDAACFYDVVLGRRRVEHHDHAVLSGRLAGQNMAAVAPPAIYTHQSMFWSDLGPQLGYEAIGIVDSRLPTVGVFSADAVTDVAHVVTVAATAEAPAGALAEGAAKEGAIAAEAERRYERGVVFYLREQRVVGVLLWNLFNRMHIARQVLAQGEFEDLFEVGKLFAPHEDE